LVKRIKRIETDKEILKKGYRSLDVGLAEQFAIIQKLTESYNAVQLCEAFEVHRSSYKYWAKRLHKVDPRKIEEMTFVKAIQG
jgi:putative transposase